MLKRPTLVPAWPMFKPAARLIDRLLAASFVLALVSYGYLGSFSRYMADDYSAPQMIRRHGFLGAQISSYQGWTGRFSFTFVADFFALIGQATPPFLPGLLLSLWFAGAVWAIYQICSLAGRISWARVVLFAAFLIFATLETAPNVSQSLYWQTGALTYVAPLIPFSFYVGVVARGVRDWQSYVLYKFGLLCAGILTFVAGGFSDAYVVLQSCGLILFIVAVEIAAGVDFKPRVRPFLIVGLVGSLLALTIVAVAPGNSVRLTYFPKLLGGWDILTLTVRYSVGFIAKQVLTHPLVYLLSLALPLLIVLRNFSRVTEPRWDRRLCTWILLSTPVAVFLLIMSCIALGVFAMSTMVPERARILLSMVLVCGTMIWSCVAGEYLAQDLLVVTSKVRQIIRATAAVTLLLLTVSPLISFFSNLAIRDKARSYAADWDRQDSELKAAQQNGVADLQVKQIGDFQSRIGKGPCDLHLRTDPTFWINRVTAGYYGIRSVRAREDDAVICR